MVYRKSNLERAEMKPAGAGQKKPAALIKGEDLLREMDLLSEYYSKGLDDPYISFELDTLMADAIERFPNDREQALTHLAQELHQVEDIVNKYHGDKESL